MRDEDAVREAVEQSAAVLANAGFPRMPARVLMALEASEDGGMTALEIADALRISAAAVSGAVRYLQTIGIVHRVAQSGSRRDRYVLPDDAWYAASVSKSPVYRMLADRADALRGVVGEPGSAAERRVHEMARFYRFMDSRLPEVLAEWEQLRDAEE
jgi:DNA-binding transcriptional regulator GbsR (MarR family)